MEHGKDPSSSAQKPSPLLGLLGILSFAFGAWALSKFRGPVHKSVHSNDPETKSDQQGNNSLDEHGDVITPKSNPPPPVTDKHEPYWYAKEFREWGIFVIELVGLFGLLYYEGAFLYTFEHGKNKGKTLPSPYAIKHLFEVIPTGSGLHFQMKFTSVETDPK